MRFVFVGALALALAACGNGGDSEDDELATDRSDISSAELDAALGPEDQSAIRDAGTEETLENAPGNDAAANSSVTSEGEEQ